jgi:hypothetical protein
MAYSPISTNKPEVIGFCPRCSKDIHEGQPTKLVLGQLYHHEHAPKDESKSR